MNQHPSREVGLYAVRIFVIEDGIYCGITVKQSYWAFPGSRQAAERARLRIVDYRREYPGEALHIDGNRIDPLKIPDNRG